MSKKLAVAYHDGGQLFAGDERHFEKGWYLFNPGKDPMPVDVFAPFSNELIEVSIDEGE
jgi:hypothetical protein